jgi:hypothetical protein
MPQNPVRAALGCPMAGREGSRLIEPVVVRPSLAGPNAGRMFWYLWVFHEEGTLSQAAAEA